MLKRSLAVMVRAAVDEFKQKLQAICGNREAADLTPELAAEITFGLQEAGLSAARAGLTAFVETWDIRKPALEINDTLYRLKMKSPKHVLTVFGHVTVNRNLYQPDKGGKTHAPLDAKWGVEGEYATSEVREATLFTLSHVTAAETEALLKKCAAFHPSATSIQAMAERTGEFVEAHEEELAEAVGQEEVAPAETRSLVISMDGVNVLLREPGPRKGRPKERPDGQSEEATTSYRNAMVGSLTFYGEVPPDKKAPERLQSRYVSHMPEEKAPTFKHRFEKEVKRIEAKLDPKVRKVMLCDGHRGIWKYVDSNPLYRGYEKLVDFFHACEHLSKAAEALFGKASADATDWYETWKEKLKAEESAAVGLIRSIDYYRRILRIPKGRSQDIRTERTFFKRNKKRMKYADFRRRGLAIGSGPVEAACKTIVKTRLCRSGMRWSRVGGQHILHLRTFVKSDRWDSFWNHYMRLAKAS